jgi:hypothetical protein
MGWTLLADDGQIAARHSLVDVWEQSHILEPGYRMAKEAAAAESEEQAALR